MTARHRYHSIAGGGRFDFTGAALPVGASLTRASSGTRFNSAGTLVTETTDVARFTYNPATLALEGLLVEPARTNILPYSYDLPGHWTAGATTLSAAAGITAPDGTTSNVSKITENGATASHEAFIAASYVNGTTYVGSSILKAGARTWARLGYFDGVNGSGAYFDLANGVVGSGSNTPLMPCISRSMKALGGGWYLCQMSATATASGGHNFAGPTTGDLVDSYAGNGTGFVYHWNSDHEAGTAGSSLILTNGATATRAADALALTLATGIYSIDITRLSGVTNLTGVAVTGNSYPVPTDVSPLQKIVTRRTG